MLDAPAGTVAPRAKFLWYTDAHERWQPKTISWAVRRCGGGSMAFPGTSSRGRREFRTLRHVSHRAARPSCDSDVSIPRIHRGMERVGRQDSQRVANRAANAIEGFPGACGREVQSPQD